MIKLITTLVVFLVLRLLTIMLASWAVKLLEEESRGKTSSRRSIMPAKNNSREVLENKEDAAEQTHDKIEALLEECKELMERKNHDYGEAWRWMRIPSITDQILVKVFRIRTLEQKEEQRVVDSKRDEYIDIINYCIFALITLDALEN